MLESKFKSDLIQDLYRLFPGCIILHNDPNELQGFPDIIILYKKKWAVLEGKRSEKEHRQPNQEYYVELTNDMSFGAFIFPENKEEILDELYETFRPRRPARISRPQ